MAEDRDIAIGTGLQRFPGEEESPPRQDNPQTTSTPVASVELKRLDAGPTNSATEPAGAATLQPRRRSSGVAKWKPGDRVVLVNASPPTHGVLVRWISPGVWSVRPDGGGPERECAVRGLRRSSRPLPSTTTAATDAKKALIKPEQQRNPATSEHKTELRCLNSFFRISSYNGHDAEDVEFPPEMMLNPLHGAHCSAVGTNFDLVLESPFPVYITHVEVAAPAESDFTCPIRTAVVFSSENAPDTKQYSPAYNDMTAARYASMVSRPGDPLGFVETNPEDGIGIVVVNYQSASAPKPVRFVHVKLIAPRAYATDPSEINIDIQRIVIIGVEGSASPKAVTNAVAEEHIPIISVEWKVQNIEGSSRDPRHWDTCNLHLDRVVSARAECSRWEVFAPSARPASASVALRLVDPATSEVIAEQDLFGYAPRKPMRATSRHFDQKSKIVAKFVPLSSYQYQVCTRCSCF